MQSGKSLKVNSNILEKENLFGKNK